MNKVNIDVETITLDNQGDDIFVGSFQVLQSGTQTSSNGIVEMSGEGLIILTYADVPNGVHPGQGVHVGPNPEAREAARQRVLAYLAEQFR